MLDLEEDNLYESCKKDGGKTPHKLLMLGRNSYLCQKCVKKFLLWGGGILTI